jgi:hypothetical protein
MLTGRPATAPKKSSRRGGGDRRRQFRRSAKSVVRGYSAYTDAQLWLADTLDWLRLWHHDAAITDELTGEPAGPNNHLSPRL